MHKAHGDFVKYNAFCLWL